MARGLKFWILKEEELYHLCSENKGADQHEADLGLCFRLCTLLVFEWGGSLSIFIPVDVIEEVHELQALDITKVRNL